MPAVVSTSTALVRGRTARFTLLDACGMPQITNSMYVTDGFITVNGTKNVDTGDEIKVRKADGTIGVYEPGRATVTAIGVEIQLMKIDPAAIAMLTGDPLIVDAQGVVVGWEERTLQKMLQNFAMEVWTGTSAAKCSSGSLLSGYMLYPMVGQSYVTIDNVGDKEITATIHGMTYGNPSWGKGPYGTAADGSSVLGPVSSTAAPVITPARLLAAVDPTAARHFEVTPVPPPAAFTTPGPVSITLPTSY